MIVQFVAHQWAGRPVQLPEWMFDLPIGHMVVAAVVLLAARASGKPIRDYLGLVAVRRRDVWVALGIGVATFVGMALLFQVTGQIQQFFGGAPLDGNPFEGFTGDKWRLILSVFIAMVVAAPIAEELLFRGLMFRGLSALGTAATIAITSVVFGLCHAPGFGWQRVVVTGCVGAVLAVMRWRTGGTSMPMITHAATNLIGASLTALMILAMP
jgi:membrane protease YdiL (CAAX protease family)